MVLNNTTENTEAKGNNQLNEPQLKNLLLKNLVVYKYCIVLLFYVHGKHLRSCRDGQLT